MKVALTVLLIMLCGCTTTQRISRPDGGSEFIVACGAALGWRECYGAAQRLCPQGYRTLDEDQGFNRKELRISCERG